jgi:inosine-uridine nucleoside N-ribohydrolase
MTGLIPLLEAIMNHPIARSASTLMGACLLLLCLASASLAGGDARIAAILDTDIGDDIDDSWALALLLKSPQFDLKLVTTTYGKATYRATLVAKMLTIAKRTDVPVGVGAGGRDGSAKLESWIRDSPLSSYSGTVYQDGVQALIDTIDKNPGPLVLISIGPSDTVAAALAKRPDLAAKVQFAGMQGAVRKGYNGGAVSPEWNVKVNIAAAKKALLAPWKQMAITPLDTCGLIRLQGERFAAIKRSTDPVVKAVLESYRIWSGKKSVDELTESSVLFDTVAVYLAMPGPKPLLTLEDLRITVTDNGTTAIDLNGMPMAVATSWTSMDGYLDYLVTTLSH